MPALVTMHRHWTPEQIAAVIDEIDRTWSGENQISQEIVLALSKMPQKPPETAAAAPELEETGLELRCVVCQRPGEVVFEDGRALCREHYEAAVATVKRKEPKEEEDGETESAGDQA